MEDFKRKARESGIDLEVDLHNTEGRDQYASMLMNEKNSNKEGLLQTIYVPKVLSNLSNQLPKANYSVQTPRKDPWSQQQTTQGLSKRNLSHMNSLQEVSLANEAYRDEVPIRQVGNQEQGLTRKNSNLDIKSNVRSKVS